MLILADKTMNDAYPFHTRLRPGAAVLAVAAWILSTAAVAHAQAVCSAPHSSPALAQGGTLRTLDPGAGWVQVSLFAQNADDRFDWDGDRRPFFAGGEATTRSAYFTAAVGLVYGIDLWAQAALHRLRYADEGGARDRTGLGDLRVAARVSPELFYRDWPVSLRAGLKLAGSRFPVDATVLPLSEGQTDAELALETGRAFRGGTLYLLGWLGYRWRFGETTARRIPGDETFAHVALGGSAGALRWELAAEGLLGRTPTEQGLQLATDRRRLLQISPNLAWSAAGPGELNIGLQLPLAGRNLPADPGMSIGYRWTWR